jgi:hypothetical protein
LSKSTHTYHQQPILWDNSAPQMVLDFGLHEVRASHVDIPDLNIMSVAGMTPLVAFILIESFVFVSVLRGLFLTACGVGAKPSRNEVHSLWK